MHTPPQVVNWGGGCFFLQSSVLPILLSLQISRILLPLFYMNPKTPFQDGIRHWEAVGIVWDLLLGIIVPIVLLALAGRWLDERFQITPLGSIAGLVLGLVIVTIIVLKQAKHITNRMKKRTPPPQP
jgi:hypothetical protein